MLCAALAPCRPGHITQGCSYTASNLSCSCGALKHLEMNAHYPSHSITKHTGVGSTRGVYLKLHLTRNWVAEGEKSAYCCNSAQHKLCLYAQNSVAAKRLLGCQGRAYKASFP